MVKYIPGEFEKKLTDKWEKEKTYRTPAAAKNKKYVLDMFPYPSGAGLHVGHPRGYTATDILARYYRMSGFSVLHPMGWDAFGLPAENAAVKAKKNPMDMVPDNIATFKRQMKMLGFSYDWDREFATTDPDYYRWTQWLFIRFFKMGLLYKKNTPINFCPVCKTGLAEEEVLPNGTHERCGNPITKKDLPQWIFKITAYADRLLNDLKSLQWPDGILEMQKNWIGRKEGMFIKHKIKDLNLEFETFTAYPAWSFADTFIVIAPEHPLIKTLVAGTKQEKDAELFIAETRKITSEQRLEDKFEKKGVFTGRYAADPFGGPDMPVWIANFALMDFGTGIIRCSAHDPRDWEFAGKYKIPLKEIIDRVDDKPVHAHDNKGVLKNSGPFTGKRVEDSIEDMIAWIEKQGIGRKTVTYHLRDWIFSRQRYWGEPIPMVNCKKDGWVPLPESELPLKLPYVKSYEPSETGESPLSNIKGWVKTTCPKCGNEARRETDTMPNWAGSCWYFLRFPDPKDNQAAWDKKIIENWLPVDWYVGGAEHAVLHLLYARFWVKALQDMGLVNFSEPFLRLRNVGMILAEDHRKMSKSWGNVINPDDVVKEYGADTLRMYEMFMAPFSQEISWSTKTLQGAYRFLTRIWKLYDGYKDQKSDVRNQKLEAGLNKTIKKVTRDIEQFKFNTAIAAMMEFLNLWEGEKTGMSSGDAKKFLKILAPFAPFITEEIWENVFQEKTSIHLSKWPEFDTKEVVEEEIVLPVEINGKLRDTIKIQNSKFKDQNYVVNEVMKSEKVKQYLSGKSYKVIYVPGKIINLILPG